MVAKSKTIKAAAVVKTKRVRIKANKTHKVLIGSQSIWAA
jgi:hypothetical protein